MLPRLAITTGEPAGIGPEISVAALDPPLPAAITLIGDAGLIATRAALLSRRVPESVEILHVPLAAPSVAGALDVRNARYVLATLDAAIDGCTSGRFDAVVTAPVQKSVINEAGVPFSGHTEYLAERTSTAQVVMMLAGATNHGPLRVALATTHLPLASVSAAISPGLLAGVLRIIDDDLRLRFGITHPRIAVAGLNPHAGESGHLGREEIDVIAPAIERARRDGIDAQGPLPADTMFVPAVAQRFDALLAMYHDQGLPVLKYATFGHGVNVTLGLPFVRTSVDHGTALDRAGQGTADSGSLRAALELAVELVARQRA
ncbi:MAG TPA: 4-hydroxythreonine-4-phosphate dehydrogenase PdxA [Burkholderiaceae bacterium]|nr:4-hydroxythreonine-4-phosphate dehydrogenase PdxA [Burkholderiaceae bacterium]HQR76627.1 4-hydroxythreonine-4-phosphate dehydrogenase PdxA [Burkholderiaceae bacterium]